MPTQSEPVSLQTATGRFDGCVGHVRVIELDVPAEDPPHPGKDGRPIKQRQIGRITSDEVVVIDPRVGCHLLACPFGTVDLIRDRNQCLHQIPGNSLGNDGIPVPFELL